MILSIVRDLFKSFEGQRMSVIVILGSERGLIVDLACLGKKNFIRCQFSSSKIILVHFYFF